MITSDEVKKSKSYSNLYLMVAKKLNVDITKCILFGDSVAGISAGNDTGC